MGRGSKLTDEETLQMIVDYCNKIEAVVDFLGADFSKYEQSWWLKDIVAMNVLQIGERIGSNLSQVFRDSHTEIPWSDYVGIRNRFAHQYFATEDEIVWETAIGDIPELKLFCVEQLRIAGVEVPTKHPIKK